MFEAKGDLRPVQSTHYIQFIPSTFVVLYPHDDGIIPMHKFDFVPLGELTHRSNLLSNDQRQLYSTCIV